MNELMNILLLIINLIIIINFTNAAEENLGQPTTLNKFPAAVDSYHQIRYIEVPTQKHGPKQPQIHTVTTNSVPMKLLFRSTSSHLHIDQQDDHVPNNVSPLMNQYPSSSLEPMPYKIMTLIPISASMPRTPVSLATNNPLLYHQPLIPIYSTTAATANRQFLPQQPITGATQFIWPLNIYPMMPIHNNNDHHQINPFIKLYPINNFNRKLSTSLPPTPLPLSTSVKNFVMPFNNHRSNNNWLNNFDGIDYNKIFWNSIG